MKLLKWNRSALSQAPCTCVTRWHGWSRGVAEVVYDCTHKRCFMAVSEKTCCTSSEVSQGCRGGSNYLCDRKGLSLLCVQSGALSFAVRWLVTNPGPIFSRWRGRAEMQCLFRVRNGSAWLAIFTGCEWIRGRQSTASEGRREKLCFPPVTTHQE